MACTWFEPEVSPALNRCLELLTFRSAPFFSDSVKAELFFIAEYSRIVSTSLENIIDQYCFIGDAVGSGLRQRSFTLYNSSLSPHKSTLVLPR